MVQNSLPIHSLSKIYRVAKLMTKYLYDDKTFGKPTGRQSDKGLCVLVVDQLVRLVAIRYIKIHRVPVQIVMLKKKKIAGNCGLPRKVWRSL